jgi:hypothetical protein
MLRLAKDYDPQDVNKWDDAHTLGQKANQIAENLEQRGFALVIKDPETSIKEG